ncbi:hypothetical protein AA042_19215 [Pseudomonas lundensis]|nr:hypothetical protein AA042_19215 [Pseudomonas lundensis]
MYTPKTVIESGNLMSGMIANIDLLTGIDIVFYVMSIKLVLCFNGVTELNDACVQGIGMSVSNSVTAHRFSFNTDFPVKRVFRFIDITVRCADRRLGRVILIKGVTVQHDKALAIIAKTRQIAVSMFDRSRRSLCIIRRGYNTFTFKIMNAS